MVTFINFLKFIFCLPQHKDWVAEWLRRWTANPMGSARVGSNPILVDIFFFSVRAKPSIAKAYIPLPGIEPGPPG